MNVQEYLYRPITNHKFYSFSEEDKGTKHEVCTNSLAIPEIGIEIIPLNISETSGTTNLLGQLVCVRLKCDDFKKKNKNNDFDINIEINNNVNVIKFSERRVILHKYLSINLTDEMNSFFNTEFIQKYFPSINYSTSTLKTIHLIHNGIIFPNIFKSRYKAIQIDIDGYEYIHNINSYENGVYLFGLLYFQDNLIPDLYVSRDSIKKLDFNIYSSFFYATRRLNNLIPNANSKFNFLNLRYQHFSLKSILEDELVVNKKWDDEKVFIKELKLLSINELRTIVTENGGTEIDYINHSNLFVEQYYVKHYYK